MNAKVLRLIKPHTTMSDLVMLLLRVGFGGMICYGHGWDKINNAKAASFPDPLGIGNSMSYYSAVGAEFGCGLLIALGLLTRVACAPLIFAMCVAFFVVHKGSLTFVPNSGASEPAAMYLVAFAVIMLGGPGKYSLDQVLFAGKGGK